MLIFVYAPRHAASALLTIDDEDPAISQTFVEFGITGLNLGLSVVVREARLGDTSVSGTGDETSGASRRVA